MWIFLQASNWYNFGIILRKIVKQHFLKNLYKSPKTHQDSNSYNHPVGNNDPFKKEKKTVFGGCFLKKQKG